MIHYIVETRIGYDWENVWEDDGQPTTFPTRAEAEQAIDDMLHNMPDHLRDEYQVTEVTS